LAITPSRGLMSAINSQVINRLWEADLVIADMSFHNANAFYELAVAHVKLRPTIHMIRKDFPIPFDVAPYRAILFSTDEYRDLGEARRTLKDAVAEAIKLDKVENPVTHARGAFELAEKADPAIQVIAAELQNLKFKMEQLEAAYARGIAGALHPSLQSSGMSSGIRVGTPVLSTGGMVGPFSIGTAEGRPATTLGSFGHVAPEKDDK
jgi:hypothetical protein